MSHFLKKRLPWVTLGMLAGLVIGWFLTPGPVRLAYKGHKFTYLEPPGASTNRAALLEVWVGYQGRRPRWWGGKVESRILDGHEWSFSNGPAVQGGGGSPATAEYDREKDCYRYALEKGLTVYRLEGGKPVPIASGLATGCKLKITFLDPRKGTVQELPLTLPLKDGEEVFKG